MADPSTLGRHKKLLLENGTQPQKRSVCGGYEPLEPQTAVCSPQFENNGFLREYIPATKTRPPVAKLSGQCARALNAQTQCDVGGGSNTKQKIKAF